MRSFRPILAAFVAALTLGACASSPSLDPRTWFARDATPAPKAREAPGVDARLQSVTSSASGAVRIRESGDLLVMLVDLASVPPGSYRVVLHANGNCSSPNGFSAGPPWSPPGWREPPTRLFPEMYVQEGTGAQMTARVRGVRLGDLAGRSVLVYQGLVPQIPQPGVPNNVMACGVFEQSKALF